MKPSHVLRAIFVVCSLATLGHGQDEVFTTWEDRVRTTLAQQPSWPTALYTPNAGLVQLFRTEFVRQITPDGTSTWNYGNSRGFDLVPWYKTEFDATVPAYIQHNSPLARDGFGDVTMLLKYRVFCDAEVHFYCASVSLGGTIPTGSYSNGSLAGTISPTMYGGKGFRRFDVQSSLGAVLPTGYTTKLGRPVMWNSVVQYKVLKIFWPEVENNATYFHGGPHDGKTQGFITPGLMVSKLKLEHAATNRLALIFGAGEQIAASHYHGYNHALIFTTRLAF